MAPEPESPIALLAALLSGPAGAEVAADAARWAVVRQHASRHGVAQLAAFLARPHVPATERAWCDEVLTRGWKRHVRNLACVERSLGMLQAEGIAVLPLKGPVLASRFYQPPFLRKPSMDIDLAVRESELQQASEIFSGAGYTPEMPLRDAVSRSHHLAMIHPAQPRLELHFRLSHGAYGVPVDEFFDRAVPHILPGGLKVGVMAPEDEIFHLVLHRAFGRFATLFHLYEVRRLWAAATPEVRARTLLRAADHHFAGAFALTDVALRVRWGEGFLAAGDLPKTWLHWRIGEKLYEQFERLSEPGRELPLAARLGRRWIDFQVTDGPSDAGRLLAVMARVAFYQIRNRGWKTVKVG